MLEEASNFLNPYTKQINQLAAFLIIMNFVSGGVLVWKMRITGRIRGYSPDSLFGGILLALITMKLSLLNGDDIQFNLHLLGLVANIVFLLIFIKYTWHKLTKELLMKSVVSALFVGSLFAHLANVKDPSTAEYRLELAIGATIFLVTLSQFRAIPEIVIAKESRYHWYYLVIMRTLLTISWSLYGLATKKYLYCFQNLIITVINCVMLRLCLCFFRYINKTQSEEEILEELISPELIAQLFDQDSIAMNESDANENITVGNSGQRNHRRRRN